MLLNVCQRYAVLSGLVKVANVSFDSIMAVVNDVFVYSVITN